MAFKMSKDKLLEAFIPFQNAPINNTPPKGGKKRFNAPDINAISVIDKNTNIIDDYIRNDSANQSAPGADIQTVMSVDEQIQLILSEFSTIFEPEDIKVKFRDFSNDGLIYDVYFKGANTILYIKPLDNKVGLINRNMDKDFFADVLEDIQEINVDDPKKKSFGKRLISIIKDDFEQNKARQEQEAKIAEDETIDNIVDEDPADAPEEAPVEDLPPEEDIANLPDETAPADGGELPAPDENPAPEEGIPLEDTTEEAPVEPEVPEVNPDEATDENDLFLDDDPRLKESLIREGRWEDIRQELKNMGYDFSSKYTSEDFNKLTTELNDNPDLNKLVAKIPTAEAQKFEDLIKIHQYNFVRGKIKDDAETIPYLFIDSNVNDLEKELTNIATSNGLNITFFTNAKTNISENKKEGKDMKTVKDIKNDWGYKFVSSKNDRASIVEYFEKPELSAFGGFFIKLNESGNSYDGIYGIYGSNPDLKKEAIPVVVDGSFIFEAMADNANRGNQFEVGEMVKINLNLVESTTSVYAKQIRNIVRKNKGFAVVVGVDGNQIKIAESVNQGKATGGILINSEAIEKINGIKSACEIYEDKDVVADWTQKMNEKKKVDTTDYTEVPEEAMELNLFPKK